MGKLTDTFVRAAKVGKFEDGDGLRLIVTETRKRWTLRYTLGDRRPEMTLGQYPDLKLSDARRLASEARGKLAAGIDPLVARRTAKQAQKPVPTFGQIAEMVIAAEESKGMPAKGLVQLKRYLGPAYVGKWLNKPVNSINSVAVLELLTPLRREKPEATRKLYPAIRKVFGHARIRLRDDHGIDFSNPAYWDDLKAMGYAAPERLTRGSHPSAHHSILPEVMAAIRASDHRAARMLELVILTNVRTDAVRHARAEDFDLENAIWTIPPAHLKDKKTRGEKAFRVPLTSRAVEVVNAHRFVRFCDGNIKYVHEFKSWFIWTGEYWAKDISGQIKRLANSCVEQMFREALEHADPNQRDGHLRHAMKSQSKTSIDNMVALARDMVPLSATALDADPLLLGVLNGVVNLRTGKFRACRKSDYITKRANVVFDANATCPNWDEFQDKISGGDKELVAFKQRMYGLVLSGKLMELLFTLYGSGSNGKSTEVTVIYHILGDYGTVSDRSLIMERKNKDRNASPEVVALKGKRLVVINETSEGDVLDDSNVKRCTSDEPITGRGLYQDLITFMPTHTALLLTNHKPWVKGTDFGIWRRLAYVPYPVTIPLGEQRKNYRDEVLLPEASGILNWMIAGWKKLYKNDMKIDMPKVVTDAAEEYKKEQNTVRQFVDSLCEVKPKEETTLQTLYAAYKQWMEVEYGYRGRGQRQMSAELVEMGRSMGFEKIKDGGGYTAFRGLGLKM